MDETTLLALIARARAETNSYPQYATRLARSGIDSYRVDVAAHTIDWRAAAATYREVDEPVIAPGSLPGPYMEAAVVQALRRNQRGETDYPGFLREVWAAGVVGYYADLRARTVTYCGHNGEHYTEAVPTSD